MAPTWGNTQASQGHGSTFSRTKTEKLLLRCPRRRFPRSVCPWSGCGRQRESCPAVCERLPAPTCTNKSGTRTSCQARVRANPAGLRPGQPPLLPTRRPWHGRFYRERPPRAQAALSRTRGGSHRPSQVIGNCCSEDVLPLRTPALGPPELRLRAQTQSQAQAAAGLSLGELQAFCLSVLHPKTCSHWQKGDRQVGHRDPPALAIPRSSSQSQTC